MRASVRCAQGRAAGPCATRCRGCTRTWERPGSCSVPPWPYGLEPDRTVLHTLLRYLRAQGLLSGELTLGEAFARVSVFGGQ